VQNFIRLSSAALLLSTGIPAAFAAQTAPQSQGPSNAYLPSTTIMAKVIEIQANPRGLGPASATPPNPVSAESPVPPSMPADLNYHAGPYVGALTPPPLQAMNKTYPLCSKSIHDSCINPGQARDRSRTEAINRRVTDHHNHS